MQLKSHIQSERVLLDERDHIKHIFASELSLTPKLGKLNHCTARLLGAPNWQTAMAQAQERQALSILNEDSPLAPTVRIIRDSDAAEQTRVFCEYINVRFGSVASDDVMDELIEAMDEVVWTHLGTTQFISDTVNNQGFETQLLSLLQASTLPLTSFLDIWVAVENYTTITLADYQAYLADNSVLYGLCNKCSSHLDGRGACTDETCFYSEYPQRISLDMPVDATQRFLPVTAEVYDDERRYEVEFDAALYFEYAAKNNLLADTIRGLAQIGWGGDYQSDSVAQFFEPGGKGMGHEDVRYLFANKASGFECHVDPGALGAYLQRHKPYMYANLILPSSLAKNEALQALIQS
jgi:hypothetical protein